MTNMHSNIEPQFTCEQKQTLMYKQMHIIKQKDAMVSSGHWGRGKDLVCRSCVKLMHLPNRDN